MKDIVLSLSGEWKIEYISPEKYISRKEPRLTGEAIAVKNAVPYYFEDMGEIFENSPFGKRIAINPLYKRQTYPETGYCEDTALPTYLGSFVYNRSFEVSEISNECRLYFGGAQNTVSVWLNGAYIGRHEGYSTDFEMDIPKEAVKLGNNEITLAVSNNRLSGYMGRPVSGLTSRAANECTGGIYGDIEFRISYSGIKDAWINVAKDLSSFTVNIDADIQKRASLQHQMKPFGFPFPLLRVQSHQAPRAHLQ